MRPIYLVPLCLILAAVGLVFGLGSSPSLAALSVARRSVPPAPPPSRAAPRPAQEASPPNPATGGLACIQNALGGVGVFAGVSSLRILGSTKPTATTKARPVANQREIGVVFPDRYKRHDVGTTGPDLPPLIYATGFNGRVLLSYPKAPDEVADKVMLAARRDFMRHVLMRLPRQLSGVRLSQRTTRDDDQERLAIDAYDSGGLGATLLANPRTCMPIALQYGVGLEAHRVDLSGFRRFAGILFPTVLRTSKNGQPWTDEYDSEVRVNTPIEDGFFR